MEKKYVALAFHDGPNDTTTAEILIKLLKHKVVASFFLVGNRITPESLPIVKDAYAMGCELGNHSMTHADMTTLTNEQIMHEIIGTNNWIEEITGKEPSYFSPPYMRMDEATRKNIPLPIVYGIECEDWSEEISAKERAERIIKQIKPGQIIRMHDTKGNRKTVEALDILIPELKCQEYGFVTVSKLFSIYNKKKID